MLRRASNQSHMTIVLKSIMSGDIVYYAINGNGLKEREHRLL